MNSGFQATIRREGMVKRAGMICARNLLSMFPFGDADKPAGWQDWKPTMAVDAGAPAGWLAEMAFRGEVNYEWPSSARERWYGQELIW